MAALWKEFKITDHGNKLHLFGGEDFNYIIIIYFHTLENIHIRSIATEYNKCEVGGPSRGKFL